MGQWVLEPGTAYLPADNNVTYILTTSIQADAVSVDPKCLNFTNPAVIYTPRSGTYTIQTSYCLSSPTPINYEIPLLTEPYVDNTSSTMLNALWTIISFLGLFIIAAIGYIIFGILTGKETNITAILIFVGGMAGFAVVAVVMLVILTYLRTNV